MTSETTTKRAGLCGGLGWAMWTAISLVAAFLAAELTARLVLPAQQHELRDRFLVDTRRDRRPYVGFGEPPYNGPHPAAEKGTDEVRVFVLGGSTVEHGDPAIPEILERLLHHRGYTEARVFNFGVVGQNSGQELARLVFDIRPLEPDVVVMYNGVNDILPPAHLDPRPGYPFDFIVFENNPLLVERIGDYPLFGLLANGSLLLRTCCSGLYANALVGLDDLRYEIGWDTPAWRTEIAAAYVDHVVGAARVSDGLGAEFAWFFQPMVYYKSTLSDEERPFSDTYREHSLAMREAIRSERRRALDAGALREDRAVDLSEIFNSFDGQVYWNDSHIVQDAQSHVAEQILPTLIAMVDAHRAADVQRADAVEVGLSPGDGDAPAEPSATEADAAEPEAGEVTADGAEVVPAEVEGD